MLCLALQSPYKAEDANVDHLYSNTGREKLADDHWTKPFYDERRRKLIRKDDPLIIILSKQ